MYNISQYNNNLDLPSALSSLTKAYSKALFFVLNEDSLTENQQNLT